MRTCVECGREFATNNPLQKKHKGCLAKVKKYPKIFYDAVHSVWARDKQTCQECAYDFKDSVNTGSRQMLVHHIDGDPKNNDLKNLVVLCSGCHIKMHRRGLKEYELEDFELLEEKILPITRKKQLFKGI